MKKIIYDKIAYVVAVLILMAFSYVATLNNRVSALERNDAANLIIHQTIVEKLDEVKEMQKETLGFLLKNGHSK